MATDKTPRAHLDVDASFDYWADMNPGRSVWEAKNAKDPDTRSKRLQAAHLALWTKPLPTGPTFALTPARGAALQWGHYRLSSDSISNSYMTNGRLRAIVQEAREQAEKLFRTGSKIGAYILFPGYRVAGRRTINGARGMSPRIADRMDLTLEAIQRHYVGGTSPLSQDLARYADFFALFSTFRGYVDFWLLNDLVDHQYRVQFFLPFDDFGRNGAPSSVREYLQLATATTYFLNARTERMRRALSGSPTE
jgi:hypothetical protein